MLNHRISGTRIVPRYLAEHDHPWLRELLDDLARHTSRPWREVEDRWREPFSGEVPADKWALAVHVLLRSCRAGVRAPLPPRKLRDQLFTAAAAGGQRADLIASVAGQLHTNDAAIEQALFADLPGERAVLAPDPPPSPVQLALQANLALAQALVARASVATIEADGNARVLVRHAKLRGLICSAEHRASAPGYRLRISGPYALFRHTLLYGRALGELIPLCAWCRTFRLRAACMLGDHRLELEIAPSDPIFPADEPRRFDSRLEARFARDLARLTSSWIAIREAEPITTATGRIIFPDFVLQHRDDPKRRWHLEIVGFWTPDYVTGKLADYRAAHLDRLILCIDDQRNCADGDLPPGAHVLRYRRHIDAAAVLAILEPRAS